MFSFENSWTVTWSKTYSWSATMPHFFEYVGIAETHGYKVVSLSLFFWLCGILVLSPLAGCGPSGTEKWSKLSHSHPSLPLFLWLVSPATCRRHNTQLIRFKSKQGATRYSTNICKHSTIHQLVLLLGLDFLAKVVCEFFSWYLSLPSVPQ